MTTATRLTLRERRIYEECYRRGITVPPPKPDARYHAYQQKPLEFGIEILGESYPDDVQAVMTSVVANRVTIARSANSVGKTFCAAELAIWFYKTYPGAQVILLAAPPVGNLETKLFGEIAKRMAKHPELFKGDRSKYLMIRRAELEFIRGIPIPSDADPAQVQASIAGSHAPAILYIIDEGDGVPSAVYDAIESCMTGGHARLLVLFNPRMAAGHLYNMEAEERANVVELSAFRHPNVVEGRDIYPGAVDRATTVRRIIEWTRPLNPGEVQDGECFEVPDYLEGCTAISDNGREYPPLSGGYRRIEDIRFCYMVLGQYSARGSELNYFNKSYLSGLYDEFRRRDPLTAQYVHQPVQTVRANSGRLRGTLEIYREPRPSHTYVLGADVAKGVLKDAQKTADRDYSTMDIFDCTLDHLGGRLLEHVASYWGREACEPKDFGRDMAAVASHYNGALVVCEQNGPGDAALEELCNEQRYPHVYHRKPNPKAAAQPEARTWGFVTTTDTKAMVDSCLADAINEASRGIGKLVLRGPRAIRELMDYGYLEGGKFGALAGHDDHPRAIGLAVYACRHFPPVVMSQLKPVEPASVAGTVDVARW